MNIEIYSIPNCPFCTKAKALAEMKGADVTYKMMNEDYTFDDVRELFPHARTFPQIIVDGEYVGGYTELEAKIG